MTALGVALFMGQALVLSAQTAPESFADLAEQISPSVVNITTSSTVATSTGPDMPMPQIPEGSPFDAEAALHHDLEGALRAFRYLAQKAAAGYDPNDARGKKTQVSIARHLETIESLKKDVIDRLFPLRPEAP